MSIQFSDTTNYKGLVQFYEREIGANIGDVSSSTRRLKEFTADANVALDDYFNVAIKASGKWKLDDSNHDTLPTLTQDIVSGTYIYDLGLDQYGTRLLDLYKVYIKSNGEYVELIPADPDTESGRQDFNNGATGTPTHYDKVGDSLVLSPIPNANITDGLRISVNREPHYFSYDDTTAYAGVRGTHHKYFYLKPALDYARRNSLSSVNRLEAEVLRMERQIELDYTLRSKDEHTRLSINVENNK